MSGIAKKSTAHLLCIHYCSVNLSDIDIRIDVGKREASFPSFRLNLVAHDNVADGFCIGFPHDLAITDVNHIPECIGHIFTCGDLNNNNRFLLKFRHLN